LYRLPALFKVRYLRTRQVLHWHAVHIAPTHLPQRALAFYSCRLRCTPAAFATRGYYCVFCAATTSPTRSLLLRSLRAASHCAPRRPLGSDTSLLPTVPFWRAYYAAVPRRDAHPGLATLISRWQNCAVTWATPACIASPGCPGRGQALAADERTKYLVHYHWIPNLSIACLILVDVSVLLVAAALHCWHTASYGCSNMAHTEPITWGPKHPLHRLLPHLVAALYSPPRFCAYALLRRLLSETMGAWRAT